MIQILSACSTDLVSCCSEGGLSNVLLIIKNCITIIQIVVPIILVVAISINIIQLLTNPDDAKKKKAIVYKVLAAIVVIFLPIIVNTTLSIISTTGDSKTYNISDCWTNMKTIQDEMENAEGTEVDDESTSDIGGQKCYTDGSSGKKYGNCP